MSEELTKDSEYLLYATYLKYLDEIKEGIPKSKAIDIGHVNHIKESIMPEWSLDDVNSACKELASKGFFSSKFGSDIAMFNYLSDKSIIYMENRFKNNLKSIIKTLKDIKSLIFF